MFWTDLHFYYSLKVLCSLRSFIARRCGQTLLRLIGQNFAARIILGLKKFDHISEGLKSLGILKVKDRLDINDAVMVFKCLNNLAPKYLCDQLQMRSCVCTRVTRSANNLNIPRCRLATGQRRFVYRGVKIWNGLSNDLRNLPSLNAFKRNLFRQYLNKLC